MSAELPDWLKPSLLPKPSPLASAMHEFAAQTPPPSTASAPEKSLIQQVHDVVALGRKSFENNKKPTRDIILLRIRRIKFLLLSLYGKESVLVKNVGCILKEAESVKGLSPEQFAEFLSHVESFSAFLNKYGNSTLSCQSSEVSRIPDTKNVFVIHGHDELNTRRLTQLLQNNFHLNPIAMLSKPGMSRPLIEKFEEEAQTCSFAFGLFTPDDEIINSANHYKQARPNVIYEVGWFIGRLGKHRVALLLKQGTNIHSDLDGVSRIPFSDNVEDKFLDIQKELKAAKIIT
jgi:hypothetical protein